MGQRPSTQSRKETTSQPYFPLLEHSFYVRKIKEDFLLDHPLPFQLREALPSTQSSKTYHNPKSPLLKLRSIMASMRISCLILTALIIMTIMVICVMVKFATQVTADKGFMDGDGVFRFAKSMGLIALSDNTSSLMHQRFPYVAAVVRNSSYSWEFACFASVLLVKWIVTSAHCRHSGSTHRVLLYVDFARNHTLAYPITLWRFHEYYNASLPTHRYDIAVAKLNFDSAPKNAPFRPSSRTATIDEEMATSGEASLWKTVSTMDKRLYLTNDFEKLSITVAPASKCYESYGVYLDDSMFCVDMSEYDDCFIHEFGPIFTGDRLIGIMALKPRDCDMKLAIFTNVSYYTNWILRTTLALSNMA